MDKNFEDFFAIIIGINDYGNTQLNTLDLARKDATDLHEFLIKTGGYKKANTVLLVDEKATKANINYHLEQLKVKFTARSTLVFYFSGHGSNAGNNYLLPLYNYDIEDRQSYYELQELIALFSEINVDKLLFMFDTCYSGILTKAKDVLEENPDQKESQELLLEKLVETDIHNSRVLIASSLPDQTSYEIRNANIVNGEFTHCLLNGLKGACQIEKNKQKKEAFCLLIFCFF